MHSSNLSSEVNLGKYSGKCDFLVAMEVWNGIIILHRNKMRNVNWIMILPHIIIIMGTQHTSSLHFWAFNLITIFSWCLSFFVTFFFLIIFSKPLLEFSPKESNPTIFAIIFVCYCLIICVCHYWNTLLHAWAIPLIVLLDQLYGVY